jgi:hypothetical protein
VFKWIKRLLNPAPKPLDLLNWQHDLLTRGGTFQVGDLVQYLGESVPVASLYNGGFYTIKSKCQDVPVDYYLRNVPCRVTEEWGNLIPVNPPYSRDEIIRKELRHVRTMLASKIRPKGHQGE